MANLGENDHFVPLPLKRRVKVLIPTGPFDVFADLIASLVGPRQKFGLPLLVDHTRQERDLIDLLIIHNDLYQHGLAAFGGEEIGRVVGIGLYPIKCLAFRGRMARPALERKIADAEENWGTFVYFDTLQDVRVMAQNQIGAGVDRRVSNFELIHGDHRGDQMYSPMDGHYD